MQQPHVSVPYDQIKHAALQAAMEARIPGASNFNTPAVQQLAAKMLAQVVHLATDDAAHAAAIAALNAATKTEHFELCAYKESLDPSAAAHLLAALTALQSKYKPGSSEWVFVDEALEPCPTMILWAALSSAPRIGDTSGMAAAISKALNMRRLVQLFDLVYVLEEGPTATDATKRKTHLIKAALLEADERARVIFYALEKATITRGTARKLLANVAGVHFSSKRVRDLLAKLRAAVGEPSTDGAGPALPTGPAPEPEPEAKHEHESEPKLELPSSSFDFDPVAVVQQYRARTEGKSAEETLAAAVQLVGGLNPQEQFDLLIGGLQPGVNADRASDQALIQALHSSFALSALFSYHVWKRMPLEAEKNTLATLVRKSLFFPALREEQPGVKDAKDEIKQFLRLENTDRIQGATMWREIVDTILNPALVQNDAAKAKALVQGLDLSDHSRRLHFFDELLQHKKLIKEMFPDHKELYKDLMQAGYNDDFGRAFRKLLTHEDLSAAERKQLEDTVVGSTFQSHVFEEVSRNLLAFGARRRSVFRR